MKNSNSKGLFAKWQGGALPRLLFAVLFVAAVLLFVNFFYLSTQAAYDKEYLAHTGELRVLSQQIARQASDAAAGHSEGFQQLQAARNAFDEHWSRLEQGDPQTGLPSSTGRLPSELGELAQGWTRLRKQVNIILNSQAEVESLHSKVQLLVEQMPAIQLQYEEVVNRLLSQAAPVEQLITAQRQSLLAERIMTSLSQLLAGGDNKDGIADSFAQEVRQFGRVLNSMREGSTAEPLSRVSDGVARATLQDIAERFSGLSGAVEGVVQASPELLRIREAAMSIQTLALAVLEQSTVLVKGFEGGAKGRLWNTLAGYLLAALILATIVLIAAVNMRAARRAARRAMQETAEKNDRNQAAILRLLDEIGDLADGDLTTQATVTEDFTGAIADAINFTIDQLRELVGTINTSAVQVSSAAEDTQATASKLAEASEHQAQEIAGASAAINEMAVSIDQVSANAAESAAVAERSVDIANKGSEVVHNTISGMDRIREQIQDTSKRIKRLGESSQEIGDIVSLIHDIADQTNILALNAAIQASMAGDAGRGFAVVADEVQRLAERSSAATKQIEALVKTIQTDTNEAVISMEQTTTEVVRGANLAQNAGVSLEEIENVSRNLASLIQNISNAARQQASSAGHISNTMNVIQEITSQTSSGTMATAQSIGHLARLANEMRGSVSGFTLPGQK